MQKVKWLLLLGTIVVFLSGCSTGKYKVKVNGYANNYSMKEGAKILVVSGELINQQSNSLLSKEIQTKIESIFEKKGFRISKYLDNADYALIFYYGNQRTSSIKNEELWLDDERPSQGVVRYASNEQMETVVPSQQPLMYAGGFEINRPPVIYAPQPQPMPMPQATVPPAQSRGYGAALGAILLKNYLESIKKYKTNLILYLYEAEPLRKSLSRLSSLKAKNVSENRLNEETKLLEAKLEPIWIGEVENNGNNPDLREVINYLIIAGFEHLGESTGKQQFHSLSSGDKRIKALNE
tara:strand:+ start:92 stop:976 length:885 start_codon:yes stop_codon:yes gene_type:complete